MQKIKDLLDNFASQLLAFQQKIIERDGIPTEKELQFQVRTVNAMAKLEKMIARDAAIQARELKEQEKKQKASAAFPVKPPVSQEDFEEYSFYICSDPDLDATSSVRFRGNLVNSWWLEYNLFQYMLPVTERRFIHNPGMLKKLDYPAYRQQMREFMDQNAAA